MFQVSQRLVRILTVHLERGGDSVHDASGHGGVGSGTGDGGVSHGTGGHNGEPSSGHLPIPLLPGGLAPPSPAAAPHQSRWRLCSVIHVENGFFYLEI